MMSPVAAVTGRLVTFGGPIVDSVVSPYFLTLPPRSSSASAPACVGLCKGSSPDSLQSLQTEDVARSVSKGAFSLTSPSVATVHATTAWRIAVSLQQTLWVV